MTNLKSISIPFSGFYETSHDHITCDSVIDSEKYNLMEDGATTEQQYEWSEKFISGVNWQAVHIDYCKLYVDKFEAWLKENSESVKPKLIFEEMTSPREYNYATDKIYVKIEFADLEEMFNIVKADELPKLIKEKCTSRSGFISFYSNNHNEWYEKPLEKWDEVELTILFEAFVSHVVNCFYQGDKYMHEVFEAYSFMEDVSCNGQIDDIVWGNMTDEFKKFNEELRNSLEKEKV